MAVVVVVVADLECAGEVVVVGAAVRADGALVVAVDVQEVGDYELDTECEMRCAVRIGPR